MSIMLYLIFVNNDLLVVMGKISIAQNLQLLNSLEGVIDTPFVCPA